MDLPSSTSRSFLGKRGFSEDECVALSDHEDGTASGRRSPVRRRLGEQREADTDDDESCVFSKLIREGGCTPSLSEGGGYVVENSRKLRNFLEARLVSSGPDRLRQQFLKALEKRLSDPELLRRLLLPLGGATHGLLPTGESLVRILLNIPILQSVLMKMLLEKLPEHITEADEDSAQQPDAPFTSPGGVPVVYSLPRLIINQFRWLDFIIDGPALTRKLLEIVPICPLLIKRDIIGILPEVIVDADHELVVRALEDLLDEDTRLVASVLDAFANLTLAEELTLQVVFKAMNSLRTADADDLPVVVRFLLQSTTPCTFREVVQEIRRNLNFLTFENPSESSKTAKWKQKAVSAYSEALVLEAIRYVLRFRKELCDVFLKEIKAVERQKNHKVIDFWVLLVVHANGGLHRKAAETILRKKIVQGQLGDYLLQSSIHKKAESLKDYFPTLLNISETFMRAREAAVRQFACKTYALLFESFADSYHRQEVLAALITHTGSVNNEEVGPSMETLVSLATTFPHELLPFANFIKGT
ncbi:hypothetical protein CBR_g3147 [Chara braunii]|uniref:Uncharacterized protein n=1 Tax=Chara braunii TaxID=69332 RepID=A0A388KEW4_CHABU|nr:hypothetical protein CBR_g3147 [Chara braunii]|eukprot:GBG68605.1 hypothetical protein CBR_g3147 [Chara braunii]